MLFILMDIRVGVLKRERFEVKLSSIYIYFFKFLSSFFGVFDHLMFLK